MESQVSDPRKKDTFLAYELPDSSLLNHSKIRSLACSCLSPCQKFIIMGEYGNEDRFNRFAFVTIFEVHTSRKISKSRPATDLSFSPSFKRKPSKLHTK